VVAGKASIKSDGHRNIFRNVQSAVNDCSIGSRLMALIFLVGIAGNVQICSKEKGMKSNV
jgi:hypothetical protein